MRITTLLIALLLTMAEARSQTNPTILTGADQMGLYLPLLKGARVAVFANQTSMIGKTHLVDSLLKKGIHIRKIFSPEHGFRGQADAGEHVNSLQDPESGIPIISLYGSKLKPSVADLADVDILLFDIQDVGVRWYTYISSLQEIIESAMENHCPLILLDRPNPNGYYVDGPVLDPKFRSFVGMQPVPVVYGMTMGEYARMVIGEQWLRVDSMVAGGRAVDTGVKAFRLIVIPCRNYTHQSKYRLPVRPSPNLPDMQSVYLYPSLCFFEGTAISLGRGTDKPFQQFGHPAFPKDQYSYVPRSVEGAKNPPLLNQTCYGYDLSKVDVSKETADRISLKWLIHAYQLFPDKDSFFLGGGRFFDKLAGGDFLRQQIKRGLSEDEIRRSWEPALGNFKKIRKKYLLYPDFGD